MSRMDRPVACFSYLAAAMLLQVPRFPLANYGAEVLSVERSIAADAPMAAAVLAALGVPTLLLANEIGNDQKGSQVRAWLQRYGVNSTIRVTTDTSTPQVVVVADDDGTRTWFPHLPGVSVALAAVDLSPLFSASFAYVDCYQLIEAVAVRVVQAVRSTDIPLLVNLGGSPLSSAIIAAVRGYPRVIVQTSIDDAESEHAPRAAHEILAATGAAWVVITAGAAGAVAVSESQQLAGSSPWACAESLAKLGWEDLAQKAASVSSTAKAKALLELLGRHRARGEKVVVFTAYRRTLQALAALVTDHGFDAAVYHGSLTRADKDAAVGRFADATPVLLSTEAAGEGRNLQFCHVMVNFDLPWNPMQIEQRLGRIHRIGQQHDVQLTNLVSRGTLEEIGRASC